MIFGTWLYKNSMTSESQLALRNSLRNQEHFNPSKSLRKYTKSKFHKDPINQLLNHTIYIFEK